MTELSLDRSSQPQADGRLHRKFPTRWLRILLYLFLTGLVIAYSMPGIGVLITSIKTTEEISRDGLWSMPNQFRLSNYTEAWTNGNVRLYTVNSFLVTIPATITSIKTGRGMLSSRSSSLVKRV